MNLAWRIVYCFVCLQALGFSAPSYNYTVMHKHGSAFDYFNSICLSDKLDQVYGTHDLDLIWARELSSNRSSDMRILSIGSGDCSLEVRIATLMHKRSGYYPRMVCYDPTPGTMLTSRTFVTSHVRQEWITRYEFWDELFDGQSFDAVFAHHSLHHVVDLEGLYEYIAKSLVADGTFVVSDMMGRNGHRRWPEQLHIVHKLWNVLQKKQHHDSLLDKELIDYPDMDYSGQLNEGVRSQDVLPLMVEHFCFDKFVAFGGLSFGIYWESPFQ